MTDTGPGIPPEGLAKLFEPFHQLDSSIRRRYGGTGLGLSISRRFIELHEGRIWVESQLGIGTTFFFQLPLLSADPAGAGYARGLLPGWEYLQRTRPSTAPKSAAPPRFVVVERGTSLHRLLSRYMGHAEIVRAADLAAAVAELAEQPSRALLINDLSVAEMLAQVEKTVLPTGVPALICSVPDILESAAAFGVTDYLVKPIARDALLGALDRLGIARGTVLIVDDHAEASRLFHRMLNASGRDYRVLRATDGAQALALLRAERPDVVLLDLIMPTMDGFQVLQVRNRDPELAAIPVIIISAQDPFGQPIVSRNLAVTTQGGLSAQRLLACIQAITDALALPGAPADSVPPAAQSD